MKKQIADGVVIENISISNSYSLLKLTMEPPFPKILPGQFVQVRVEHSRATFLRRPISIHFADAKTGELWLLIRQAGEGTRQLATVQAGEKLNLIYPLGNSFTFPADLKTSLLLIGGGVGVAPLFYLGVCLKEQGYRPSFLLGAKTEKDLLLLEEFKKYGEVYITTENGQLGEKGFVVDHWVLQSQKFDLIYSCGPKPMMLAVAKYAKNQGITCEVSLENTMACGIGACLCCVEKTKKGNTCVCTEGPVFNINNLAWQI